MVSSSIASLADIHKLSKHLDASFLHGIDIDIDGILTEMDEMEAGLSCDDEDVVRAWIGIVHSAIAATATPKGQIGIYRCIRVRDLEAFLRTIEGGEPLGRHWTCEIERATSDNDTGQEAFGTDVILEAQADPAAIDWQSTLHANLTHPWEREIAVDGPVRLLRATTSSGEVIWQPDTVAQSSGPSA